MDVEKAKTKQWLDSSPMIPPFLFLPFNSEWVAALSDCCMALWKDLCAGRKVVNVYLTPEQKKLGQRIGHSLGMDENEVLRQAFMEYATSNNLRI